MTRIRKPSNRPTGRPSEGLGLNADDLVSVIQAGEKEKIAQKVKQARMNELRLCSYDFWYFCRFIQTEDEDAQEIRPFPTNYEYLRSLKKDMDDNQKVIVLKARRLMASWLMVLDQFWSAKFSGTGLPDSADAFRGGLMSIGQTEAEYLMQRISRANDKLPHWLKDFNPLVVDNQMYKEFERGGTIQAFPLKREGPQTFGFSKVGFDEMALQEAVRTVWTGLLPTLGAKGKLFAVSTPNGKQNLFADIWFEKNNQFKDIYHVKIPWDAHPEHDEKWFKAVTAGMDQQMIARMFLHSFAAYYGSPVWTGFDRKVHTAKETEIYNSPMFIGWDFGFHFPAISWWQMNARDQFVGHRELQGYDEPFDKFCEMAILQANSFYNRKKIPEIHCCPPDGLQRYRNRAQSGAVNDVAEIKQKWRMGFDQTQIRIGPKEVGTRNNEGPRLKEMRKLFRLRADGEPGIYVNEKMEVFIEGAQGGYCYPETGGEKPMDNEYGHVQDSAQMVPTCYNRMVNPNLIREKGNMPLDIKRPPGQKPTRIGFRPR